MSWIQYDNISTDNKRQIMSRSIPEPQPYPDWVNVKLTPTNQDPGVNGRPEEELYWDYAASMLRVYTNQEILDFYKTFKLKKIQEMALQVIRLYEYEIDFYRDKKELGQTYNQVNYNSAMTKRVNVKKWVHDRRLEIEAVVLSGTAKSEVDAIFDLVVEKYEKRLDDLGLII